MPVELVLLVSRPRRQDQLLLSDDALLLFSLSLEHRLIEPPLPRPAGPGSCFDSCARASVTVAILWSVAVF